MKAWDVYLRGHKVTTVFYTTGLDLEYVKRSLIDHDHYSPNITVRAA
jgi:hypothetical protein